MASVPKSYQATIKHPIPSGPAPASPPGPVGPASPTGTSPAPPTSPHTYTDTIFQVPAGKTWQVIKMLVRVPPPTELVSIWRVEKASSSGVEQMVIVHNETIGDSHAWGAAEFPFEVTNFKEVVMEDQEIFRQIVKVPNSKVFFLVQYEMSVMEFT